MKSIFALPALRWFTKALAMDTHISYTLLFRGWTVLAGGFSVVLIPYFLSPTHQGFYYTFASVLALQVFFELGLNQVVIQLVSYEAAHLVVKHDGAAYGDSERIRRLRGLITHLRRWFAVAAALFFFVVGSAGYIFFSIKSDELPVEQWLSMWIALVLFTAINLYLSPLLAIIEGTGQIGAVALHRLRQSLCGYGLMWTLLFLEKGLWAAVAVPAASAVATLLWLRQRRTLLRPPNPTMIEVNPISWRREIFPLQWRIATSWACGYMIFNLFTPVIFANHGPVEAGRVGMAMTVFSSLTTLGLSWINAKAPNFTMHISRGETEQLHSLFRAVALRSVVATALPSFCVVALVAIGQHFALAPVSRIASADTLFWIACAATVNAGVYAAAVYMRAHREEPMLLVSVTSAALTLAVVSILKENVSYMMLGYASISAFVSLPWTVLLYRRYQARHNPQRLP